jgi:hypothetical protein
MPYFLRCYDPFSFLFLKINGLPEFGVNSLFMMQWAALLILDTIFALMTSYHILKQSHGV